MESIFGYFYFLFISKFIVLWIILLVIFIFAIMLLLEALFVKLRSVKWTVDKIQRYNGVLVAFSDINETHWVMYRNEDNEELLYIINDYTFNKVKEILKMVSIHTDPDHRGIYALPSWKNTSNLEFDQYKRFTWLKSN